MIDNNTTIPSVRVSIFERIVPFAAMALAAVGGAIGAFLVIDLLGTIARAESAGIAAVAGGLAEYTWFPLIFLYAASVVGLIAVLVAVGRLMIETKTSSPSGISYLVLGTVSLIPAALTWHGGAMIVAVLNRTSEYNIGAIGATISQRSWAAVIITPIVLLTLLAWSLIPFKALHGRRFGPVACMIVVEVMLVAMTVAFQLRVFELYKIYRSAG